MASLFSRRRPFRVSYYPDGVQVRKALDAASQRVAPTKLKQIEYELATGDLQIASRQVPAVGLPAAGLDGPATRWR
jgi:hypothetical protein